MSKKKLNRAQRRASSVYQLDTLYRQVPSSDPIAEAILQAGPPSIIDFADLKVAEIDDVLFLSVPITTSAHSCERLKEIVSVAFKDQKLITVLTHNIEMLRARKLTAAQTGRILGHIQDYEAEALAAAASEMQTTVYQRVRTFLDSHKGALPAATAAAFLDSLDEYITKVEAENAETDTSAGAGTDTPDNRH